MVSSLWLLTSLSTHSVLERIWIKGSYQSQWLPQGKGDPLRSQNHDKLKSSTVGPNLPYDFWKSKFFTIFRITPKFFFALQYIKNWIRVVPWKKNFCSWKKKFSLKKTLKKNLLVGPNVEDFNSSWFWLLRGSPFTLW